MKMVLYKTIHHFFPAFLSWLRSLEDPRQEHSITYSLETMVWVGLLLFLLKLGSRRQINFAFNSKEFIKNLSFLSKEDLKRIPDDDTLAYFLGKLDPLQFYDLRAQIVNQLIRNKCLAKYRLYDYYLITIDGTGYLAFDQPHCQHCLTMRRNGKIICYYHPVVEAKIVTSNGFALSIETEFVENRKPGQRRQDCELKAFYRLTERLAKRFPQLKICLLLDALYASERVLDICKRNKWRYIITFKEGALPEIYTEYESLKKRCFENTAEYHHYRNEKQYYWWVEKINYKFKDRHYINVLECLATNKKTKKQTRYLWYTNFKINKTNFNYLANKGGRLRWKIENEGFNMQKNGGYNLEHTYSYNYVAMKNFYLLMQIAHIINQLIEKGSLLTAAVKKSLGSIRNIAKRLLEDLRTSIFNTDEIQSAFAQPFQIRFDTS